MKASGSCWKESVSLPEQAHFWTTFLRMIEPRLVTGETTLFDFVILPALN